MKWEVNALWLKAKWYCDRAHQVSHDRSEFPFFCVLSFELLARAALAFVHPALLADPKSDNGASILYVFGFPTKQQPKSVEMKTVLSRLEAIIPEFAERHSKNCEALIHLRNEELHSGALPFEAKKDSEWLPHFYGAADCLCRHMKKSLEDLLGAPASAVARQMIGDAEQGALSAVLKRVGQHREAFAVKPAEEREALTLRSRTITLAERIRLKDEQGRIMVDQCPACSAGARKFGIVVNESQPALVEGQLQVERTLLARKLWCPACDLALNSTEELRLAGVELRFFDTVFLDPRATFEFEEEDPYMNM